MDIRNQITALLKSIPPFDDMEAEQIQQTIVWINSADEIIRIEKPATPPKHLVSYTVLYDKRLNKVLLLEHKKAELLLPSGGHVDKDELPYNTAVRELKEELNIENAVTINNSNKQTPFFLSVVQTQGKTAVHTDVDLWFVFEGDSTIGFDTSSIDFKREFGNYKWVSLEEVLKIPIETLDLCMHRFVTKLQQNTF